jgi:predicted NodU family carbamoyl transferase
MRLHPSIQTPVLNRLREMLSFNLRGEPIVCSPEDAVNSFLKSNMDCLVLENIVVEKA